MSIIIENARNGILNQISYANFYARAGDIPLAEQHWEAAVLLYEIYSDYIPCLEGEL